MSKEEPKVRNNEFTVVAQDVNWRTYIAKEQRAADDFINDWGFLTKAGRGKQSLALMQVQRASSSLPPKKKKFLSLKRPLGPAKHAS